MRGAGPLAISPITWTEVAVGAASPGEERVLRAFLATFDVLPVDAPVADEPGVSVPYRLA